jgi:hypothetical protein
LPRPLLERKHRLRAIMPRIDSRLLYHDHVDGRGRALFDAVRGRDLEGIVAKWKRGRYHTDGQTTSWLKGPKPRLLANGGTPRRLRAAALRLESVAQGAAGAKKAGAAAVATRRKDR